jgi:hypothetical protein
MQDNRVNAGLNTILDAGSVMFKGFGLRISYLRQALNSTTSVLCELDVAPDGTRPTRPGTSSHSLP